MLTEKIMTMLKDLSLAFGAAWLLLKMWKEFLKYLTDSDKEKSVGAEAIKKLNDQIKKLEDKFEDHADRQEERAEKFEVHIDKLIDRTMEFWNKK